MNLSISNRTILKTNSREALEFTPVACAESFFEVREITDATTTRYRLNTPDLPDDLE